MTLRLSARFSKFLGRGLMLPIAGFVFSLTSIRLLCFNIIDYITLLQSDKTHQLQLFNCIISGGTRLKVYRITSALKGKRKFRIYTQTYDNLYEVENL